MPTQYATVAEFKARFVRDFFYGEAASYVMDADVANALNDASMVFNPGIWIDTDETRTAFLYASAHFLVKNIQAAGGLAAQNLSRGLNSRGGGTIQSKNVGQVGVTFSLPQPVSDSPILNQFQQTDYGQRYLQLMAPRLVGNTTVLDGWNDTGAPNGE